MNFTLQATRPTRRSRRFFPALAGMLLSLTAGSALSTAMAPPASAMPISDWQDQCSVSFGGTSLWLTNSRGYECLWKGSSGWTRDYYSRDGRNYGVCAGTWGKPGKSCIWF